jgi:ABC-2 type transport system ATP-binding protein
LTKRFGRTVALDQLHFEVPRGVIAGFVGPNGAGKTTTLRVFATLLKQDLGVAEVLGHNVASEEGARQVRRLIGFMPDYFGLYTDMTAGEYLDFFGAAYSIPAEKRRGLVRDILELVNLSEQEGTLIAALSRGMQQKLSLGRCLVHSPELLLLDEPASGLDPRARVELLELLRELRDMGKTIFISSHILSELHDLCDDVVIIDHGRLVYSGSVAEASSSVAGGDGVLELTVASDMEAAMAAVVPIRGVTRARPEEQLLVIEYGGECTSADIIETCVKQGVRIEDARKRAADLEHVFMHLTRDVAPEAP